MKKVTVWLGAIFALSLAKVSASPVSSKQASRWAQDFYSVQYMGNQAKSLPEFTCVYPQEGAKSDFTPYYIYNVGDNQGFVIVAGDDYARKRILAYSNKGSFRVDQMPENVKGWLKFYEEGVRLAASAGYPSVADEEVEPAEVIVPPILGEISYDQVEPYNLMCPVDPVTNRLSYSGCVATALTSIASHYQYPKQGKGKIDYISGRRNIHIQADLSESTYDWESILDTYKGDLNNYTDKEKNAIALLMRDFGYAVDMEYSSSASGATIDKTIRGVVDHMGYDSLVSFRLREAYDNEQQWVDLLKYCINNDYPCYYTGSSSGGGHAFICDGYDSRDYFHFNWGWNGLCDGYYTVNDLEPSELGSGGGTGGGYSEYQSILYNLVPQGEKRLKGDYFLTSIYPLRCYDLEVGKVYGIDTMSFTINFSGLQNFTASKFNGHIALGLYSNDTLVSIISDSVKHSSGGFYEVSYSEKDFKGSLNGVKDGRYEIWLACKSDLEGTEWNKVYAAHSEITALSYIPVTIQDGKVEREKTHVKVTVNSSCYKSVNMTLEIKSNGFPISTVQMNTQAGGSFDLAKGNYDFHFTFRDLRPVVIKNMEITKDTTLNIEMLEYIANPVILRLMVEDGDNGVIMWRKCHQDSQNISPLKYLMYLDREFHGESPAQTVTFMKYTFENLTNGYHELGIRSVFRSDTTDLVFDSIKITEASVEVGKVFENAYLGPNPSSDGQFTLYVPVACRLTVSSIDGRVIYRKESVTEGSQEIDLSSHPAGVYLFRLETEEGWKVIKAVIR